MLVTVNLIITCLYYVIALFFLIAIVRVFVKTKSIQDAMLYSLIMIPFVLRLLRLK